MNKKKITLQNFIDKANIVHNSFYDYSLIKNEPKNNQEKLLIKCPLHGEFKVNLSSHLKGTKCRSCGYEQRKERNLTHEQFLQKSKKKHNNFYDYSLTNYTGNKSIQTIICPIHGNFEQKAYQHIFGNGCYKCGDIKTKIGLSMNKEKFIEKSKIIHNNKYDYSQVNYTHYLKKVKIICPDHGLFEQTPKKHIVLKGCKKCSAENMGFNRSKFKSRCKNNKGILYIIHCYNEIESFLKIGITSTTLKNRYHKVDMPYNYQIILKKEDAPEKIWDLEKELFKKFKSFSYLPNLHFGGKTECFRFEILNLLYDI